MEKRDKKREEKKTTLEIGDTIRLYDLRDEPGLPKKDLGGNYGYVSSGG